MRWKSRLQQSGFLPLLAIGAVVALLAAELMRTVVHLRIAELRTSLRTAAETPEVLRNLSLLARLALIRERAFAPAAAESTAQYRREAEAVLLALRTTERRFDGQASPLQDFAIPLLNGINRILGLPRLQSQTIPEDELVLDLAFRNESLREYGQAVALYSLFFDRYTYTADARDFALLHRGFCYAMLNQWEQAIADFSQAEKSSNEQTAAVAAKFVMFLRDLSARIRKIEAESDPARRGELYYQAAIYYKALENFALVAEEKRSLQMRFMMARSLEETGQKEKALSLYRELIARAPASTYARQANRRLYLIGTFWGTDEELAKEARNNSEKILNDKEFLKSVSHLEQSAVELHRKENLVEKMHRQEIAALEKRLATVPAQPEKKLPAEKNTTLPTQEKKIENAVKNTTLPLQKNKVENAEKKPADTFPKSPQSTSPPKAVANEGVVKAPPTMARVPDLRQEKIAKNNEALPPEQKTEIIRNQKQLVDRITMSDGNVFYGVIYKEDENKIWLYSTLGNLELPKNEIERRDRIPGNKAFE